MANEEKLKYLEFIQMNIDRMSRASFAYKAWTVTAITALFAASIAAKNADLILISLLPVIIFWWLDSYHLEIERRFIKLFNEARKEQGVSFDLTPSNRLKSKRGIFSTAFSTTIVMLYVPLLFFILMVYSVTKCTC